MSEVKSLPNALRSWWSGVSIVCKCLLLAALVLAPLSFKFLEFNTASGPSAVYASESENPRDARRRKLADLARREYLLECYQSTPEDAVKAMAEHVETYPDAEPWQFEAWGLNDEISRRDRLRAYRALLVHYRDQKISVELFRPLIQYRLSSSDLVDFQHSREVGEERAKAMSDYSEEKHDRIRKESYDAEKQFREKVHAYLVRERENFDSLSPIMQEAYLELASEVLTEVSDSLVGPSYGELKSEDDYKAYLAEFDRIIPEL